MSDQANYVEVEHTADWSIHVRGATLPELFVNAAIGMYSLTADTCTARRRMCLSAVTPLIARAIEVRGIDTEALLVNWLNELVYHTEIEGLVFFEFSVESFEPTRLFATARGAQGRGIEIKKQIKAVTFHNLRIVSTDQGYEVTIVFDV